MPSQSKMTDAAGIEQYNAIAWWAWLR